MRAAAVSLAVALSAFHGAAVAQQDIDKLAWLAGCWQIQGGEPGTIEQWMPLAGGTLLGMSRTVRQGKTVEFEFMQLRHLADGALAFIPQPQGRPPTVFRALRVSDTEAVFENPQHDFPQRVIYAKQGDGRLLASIEGTRNGAARKIEFPFTRVACEAAGR